MTSTLKELEGGLDQFSRPIAEMGLPEFNRSEYHNPAYLALCRHIASLILLAAKNSLYQQKAIDWISAMGKEHHGKHQGILFNEEVSMVLNHNLPYPLPWSPLRCEKQYPEDKYESVLGLNNISIPAWAEQGYIIGMVGAVFDVIHAGHLFFLKKCASQCDLLIVGVDDNQIVTKNKGKNRPYNDFSVRVGTLSENKHIFRIFRIPNQLAWNRRPSASTPYVMTYWNLPNNPKTVGQIDEAKKIAMKRYPHWYERIGPNLRFFWTEGDPADFAKRAAAHLYGAQTVVFPKFTSLSSTMISSHFGLIPQPDKANRFGVDVKWV